MAEFERTSIKYKPAHIEKTFTESSEADGNLVRDDQLALVFKLEDHLKEIKEWKERVESLEFLAKNAEKLAGNVEFETEKEDILTSILALGAEGNKVDFELFKKSVEIVVDGFDQQTLVSMTGVLGGK